MKEADRITKELEAKLDKSHKFVQMVKEAHARYDLKIPESNYLEECQKLSDFVIQDVIHNANPKIAKDQPL